MVLYLVYFFIFIFGLAVGSFLNCLIWRLQTGESFLKGRSYCPHCQHILNWQDLIPVLSFLFLKGKCRYCHQKISIQYPLVELATGTLFVSTFNLQPLTFSLQNLLTTIYLLLTICFLIIIFVYDLKHYIIPDKIIYPAIVLASIFNFQFLIFKQFQIFKYSILSALGASGFFLLIFLISQGKWLGFGDVKLGFFMGLFLSFPNILAALFFSFFIGAIIGIGLILVGKKTLKSKVPFGPFLVVGTFIALSFGDSIINWYLGFLKLSI